MSVVRWREPVSRIFLPVIAGSIVFPYIVILPFIALSETALEISYILIPMTICLVAINFTLYLHWREVWRSSSARFPFSSLDAIKRLDGALRGEGMSFYTKSSAGGPPDASIALKLDEVFEVRETGLKVGVRTTGRCSMVFLGPVGKDNVEDVRKVKVVVMKALERGEVFV